MNGIPYCLATHVLKVVQRHWICYSSIRFCSAILRIHFYVVEMNECCHNVVDMFSYNVMRQRCGNILETFLEYVAATYANVSQLSPNVVETLLQPYIVSWGTVKRWIRLNGSKCHFERSEKGQIRIFLLFYE